MKSFFKVILTLFLTFSLIFILEFIFYFVNNQSNKEQIYVLDNNDKIKKIQSFGFKLIDPLLGWRMKDNEIREKGFDLNNNIIVLKSTNKCNKKKKILITGGSTSDVVLNKENWPIELIEILDSYGYCIDLHVAAVGGYSSAQELLRLIRDGLKNDIDLHISYSGVNEIDMVTYVSRYEHHIFKEVYLKSGRNNLLPNTIYFIKKKFNLDDSDVELYLEPQNEPGAFWIQNMKCMNGIAIGNNYKFKGILQPVLGIGLHKDEILENEYNSQTIKYQKYYTQLIDSVSHYDFIEDFTNIFDTCTQSVFIDDCHIRKPYQSTIAKNIFKLIQGEGTIN